MNARKNEGISDNSGNRHRNSLDSSPLQRRVADKPGSADIARLNTKEQERSNSSETSKAPEAGTPRDNSRDSDYKGWRRPRHRSSSEHEGHVNPIQRHYQDTSRERNYSLNEATYQSILRQNLNKVPESQESEVEQDASPQVTKMGNEETYHSTEDIWQNPSNNIYNAYSSKVDNDHSTEHIEQSPQEIYTAPKDLNIYKSREVVYAAPKEPDSKDKFRETQENALKELEKELDTVSPRFKKMLADLYQNRDHPADKDPIIDPTDRGDRAIGNVERPIIDPADRGGIASEGVINTYRIANINAMLESLSEVPEVTRREYATKKPHYIDDIHVITKFLHQMPKEDRESFFHNTRLVASIHEHLIEGISNTKEYIEYIEANKQSQKASDEVKNHLETAKEHIKATKYTEEYIGIIEDTYKKYVRKEPLSLDMKDITKRAEAVREAKRKLAEEAARAKGLEPLPKREQPTKWEPMTEEQLDRNSDARYEIRIHEVADILRQVETLKASMLAVRSVRQEQHMQAMNYRRDRIETKAPKTDKAEDHSPTGRVMLTEISTEEDKDRPLSEQSHIFKGQAGIDDEDDSSSIAKKKIEEIKPHMKIRKRVSFDFIIAIYKDKKRQIEQELKQVRQELESYDKEFKEEFCKYPDFYTKRGDFDKERAELTMQIHQLDEVKNNLETLKSKIEGTSEKLERSLEQLNAAVKPIKGERKSLQEKDHPVTSSRLQRI